MRLRIYDLLDPRTGKTEEVFEYPQCLASPIALRRGATLVSREPLRIPILIIPTEYLTEHTSERASTEYMYALTDLYEYWVDLIEQKIDTAKKVGKKSQLSEMFKVGMSFSYTFKTTFFTGPKEVYKQTFTDNWVYDDADRFILQSRGLFRTIEDLSFKGPNLVFITGTFECCDVVKPDTQCKIEFHQRQSQSPVNVDKTLLCP